MSSTNIKTHVKVLPETRANIEAIASARRWKLQVAVDEAVKEYVMRHDISPASDSKPQRHRRAS